MERIVTLTSNDRLHLELLGGIIPKFLAEAERRGVDTLERRQALPAILDAHSTPLGKTSEDLLRAALRDS